MGCGGGYPSAFDQSFLGEKSKKKSKVKVSPSSATSVEKKTLNDYDWKKNLIMGNGVMTPYQKRNAMRGLNEEYGRTRQSKRARSIHNQFGGK